VRSRQEATSHWRRDIKTPALHEINHETTKRNNYSSDNQFKNVGIMKAEETISGLFIGNCLVKPKKGTCPISVINITSGDTYAIGNDRRVTQRRDIRHRGETHGASNAT